MQSLRFCTGRIFSFTGRTVFSAWFMVEPYLSFIHQASSMSCDSALQPSSSRAATSLILPGSNSAFSVSSTT